HIEDRRLPRPDDEAEGAGRAGAVQKRVDGERPGLRIGTLQPERLEERKLLPSLLRRVDRQSARRQPINVVLGDGPEIAGAQERGDLVEIVRPVDWRMDTEAGEPAIAFGKPFDLTEVE